MCPAASPRRPRPRGLTAQQPWRIVHHGGQGNRGAQTRRATGRARQGWEGPKKVAIYTRSRGCSVQSKQQSQARSGGQATQGTASLEGSRGQRVWNSLAQTLGQLLSPWASVSSSVSGPLPGLCGSEQQGARPCRPRPEAAARGGLCAKRAAFDPDASRLLCRSSRGRAGRRLGPAGWSPAH